MDNEELTRRLLNEFADYEARNDQVTKSIENSNKSQNEYESIEFEWIEGSRSDSKLIWVPSEHCLYYTNVFNARLNAVACTCYEKECRARILIKKDNTAIRQLSSMPHISHGSMYHTYKEKRLFVFMKERCLTVPASASTKSIYDEAVLLLVIFTLHLCHDYLLYYEKYIIHFSLSFILQMER